MENPLWKRYLEISRSEVQAALAIPLSLPVRIRLARIELAVRFLRRAQVSLLGVAESERPRSLCLAEPSAETAGPRSVPDRHPRPAFLPRLALLLSWVLWSLARLLAEWAGMHKRVQIAVRNPGYEQTELAMGELSIDFRGREAYISAMRRMTDALTGEVTPKSAILINEEGEELGFNPEFYVSHRTSNVEEWRPTWLLPAQGVSAPPRESEA
jgi:hypothetical protein